MSKTSEETAHRRPPKIAMVVSRFPKVTETFQLREMLTLADMGVDIELFALIHMPDEAVQDDTAELDRRGHYPTLMSWEVLAAQLTWLRRNPRAYLGAWKWSIMANRRAPEFLLRTPVVVLLAAAMALRMEELGVEHVHAHYATYPTHAALVIHRLTGLTYSFTGHAHDLRLRIDGLADKIDEAEFYFTCTAFSAEDLRQFFGERAEKGIVVHHGVDPELFTFCEPRPDDGDRPMRIVSVASFEECKGHRYLIDAVAQLMAEGVDVDLVLVGGNLASGHDYQSQMEKHAADAGVADRIRFLGRQPSGEVRRWIEWSDIGALAACRTARGDMDGLPNFLTESLAMGRPVVSTTLPGVAELVTDGVEGLLVRPRDSSALAAALTAMKTDPARRAAMGIAGRATVEQHHNMTINTRILYDTYVERVGRPEDPHAGTG